MSDKKIITSQDLIDIHAMQIEEYRQEWQDQEDAKNAWHKRCLVAEQQRDELAAFAQKVADAHFDLSLHKQHDTLSHLKRNAQKALAKPVGDER